MTSVCDINFEMSSEKMMGLSSQPSDTCDYNHPLCNSMYAITQDLRVSVADAPYAEGEIGDVVYDREDVTLLQESIDGFSSWFDDLSDFFDTNIKNQINFFDREAYEEIISSIKDKLMSEDEYYFNIDVDDVMTSQIERIVEIKEGIHKSCHVYDNHQSDISMKSNEVSEMESDIAEMEDGPTEKMVLALDELRIELAALEEAEPGEEEAEKVRVLMGQYSDEMDKFGEGMQNHFTDLRALINQLKTMIKDYIDTSLPHHISPDILSYPNDYLKKTLENHSDKDRIVTSASPSVFIKKVANLEKIESKLDSDDAELLLDGDEDALAIAMARFKKDFPDYETLLMFKDDNEAKKLGQRLSLSLSQESELLADTENDFAY